MIHLDWICGAMALLSTYTIGKKLWYGWVISATTNALFVVLNTRAHLYGVVPVSALCCAMNLWNMVKWMKERTA
jgi:hypothetical protein